MRIGRILQKVGGMMSGGKGRGGRRRGGTRRTGRSGRRSSSGGGIGGMVKKFLR